MPTDHWFTFLIRGLSDREASVVEAFLAHAHERPINLEVEGLPLLLRFFAARLPQYTDAQRLEVAVYVIEELEDAMQLDECLAEGHA